MSEETQSEDIVAKYKRLLSLARSSLEANQATLAAKDQQIAHLHVILEEERAKSQKRQSSRDCEVSQSPPRKILCRVDVNDAVWILVEYDDAEDRWQSFSDELMMNDYIQRIPGVPLKCPPRCLSEEESHQIEEESKHKVERIVEEFRRYKVRTEIARKQKDAENKQALLSGSSLTSGASLPHNSVAASSAESTMMPPFLGAAAANNEDVLRLKDQLEAQEAKWRSAYEKVARENEALRNKGGEAVLAAQWRGRYESCLREKEDLGAKLRSILALSEDLSVSGRSPEQAYLELHEEFRAFRRRVAAIEKKRRLDLQHSAHFAAEHMSGTSSGDSAVKISEIERLCVEADHAEAAARQEAASSPRSSSTSSNGYSQNAGLSNSSSGGGGGSSSGGGVTESKMQYVRHLVVQYLTCRDPEVKQHMENALAAMFRLTADERLALEERRREDSQDTLASLTSYLGSLTLTAT